MTMNAHILVRVRWDQICIHDKARDRMTIDPQHRPPGWNDAAVTAFEDLTTALYLGAGGIATFDISNHGGLGRVSDADISTKRTNGKAPAYDTQ